MNSRIALFLSFIFFITLHGYGQKNKKSPYEDYWKQEELKEQFEVKRKEAYKLFQEKEYVKSKQTYEAALLIIPDDQKVLARVRDLDLLIEKERALKNQPSASPDSVQAEKEVVKELVVEEKTVEEVTVKTDKPFEKPKTEIQPPSETPITVITKTDSVIHPKDQKQPAPSTSKEPEVVEKPFKNSDNYRKYLATIYPIGWTEEMESKGNKEITKRILVQGNSGDEYMRVVHPYATYYFKNGVSISYATWVAESENPEKKSGGK